jgi:hypothetical protein
MGYYTNYKLTISSGSEITSDLTAALNETLDDGYGPLNDFVGGSESCKWYEHEKVMRSFSARFPDVLFILHGEGEETGDVWDKYFKGGKMQECRVVMTIPPFDERKLQ